MNQFALGTKQEAGNITNEERFAQSVYLETTKVEYLSNKNDNMIQVSLVPHQHNTAQIKFRLTTEFA